MNDKYIRERTGLVMLLSVLLEKPPDRKMKELDNFYKRMCRERRYIFTFLFIQEVQPDNNASELAIRNVKGRTEDIRKVHDPKDRPECQNHFGNRYLHQERNEGIGCSETYS